MAIDNSGHEEFAGRVDHHGGRGSYDVHPDFRDFAVTNQYRTILDCAFRDGEDGGIPDQHFLWRRRDVTSGLYDCLLRCGCGCVRSRCCASSLATCVGFGGGFIELSVHEYISNPAALREWFPCRDYHICDLPRLKTAQGIANAEDFRSGQGGCTQCLLERQSVFDGLA